MSEDFSYDIFLCHSSKDKAIVRHIAERLRADGIRVWLDEWEIGPGDIYSERKLEAGLEHSRILVLCMSAHAFGSDWARLENYTFRFRDPMNEERGFIPLRLDESPIKISLVQYPYISWLSDDLEQEYKKLLEACRPNVSNVGPDADVAKKDQPNPRFNLDGPSFAMRLARTGDLSFQ